jgi:hypothetical protein
MTTKQKRKARATKPSSPAGQQRTTRTVTEFDPNGIEITHHRTVDTLGLMLRSGAITAAMHDAARDFQAAFTIACFDSMPRPNLMLMARPAPGKYRPADFTDTQIAARERVAKALEALGGHGSPAGSCVWHVVGMQTSIREWALRRGWSGRPVRQESAQGILLAALGVLVKHYGIRETNPR